VLVAFLAGRVDLSDWPELCTLLFQTLDEGAPARVLPCLDLTSKLAEDYRSNSENEV
jgi:hypothetical protein